MTITLKEEIACKHVLFAFTVKLNQMCSHVLIVLKIGRTQRNLLIFNGENKMDTCKLKEAIEKVIQELRETGKEELKEKIKLHMDGDISQILLEVNYFGKTS